MKMTKIAAIVAAAALLVIGAAFTSMAADLGWQMEDGQWVYLDADGERYAECFKKSADGNQYWLDADGYMATDKLIPFEGKFYYVDATGKRVSNTWAKVYDEDANDGEGANFWYYFGSNGQAYVAPAATDSDGNPVLFKSAPISTGATEKAKFRFDENGKLVTGYMDENGANVDDMDAYTCIYYAGGEDDGIVRMNKWESLDYTVDEETKTGWFFFLKTSGKKATKDNSPEGIKWNKVTYTFNAAGVMNSGAWSTKTKFSEVTTPSSIRRFDETGAVIKSQWFKTTAPDYNEDTDEFEEFWYYAGKDGSIYSSKLAKIGTKTYAFNEEGQMLTGLQDLRINADGTTIDSVETAPTLWTDVADNSIELGTQSYAKHFYYFGSADDADTDGAMKTGTGINVTLDDETKTMGFETSGANKGLAMNGYNSKAKTYFDNGLKIAADEDSKYILIAFSAEDDKATGTAAVVLAGSYLTNDAVKKNGETVGRGRVGVNAPAKQGSLDGNGKISLGGYNHIACLNQSGTVLGTGVKTDGNDYKIYVDATKKVTGVYYLY